MLSVSCIDVWDDKFFQSFVEFKNFIHKDIPTSFPETLDGMKKYFGKDSVFDDIRWRAYRVFSDDRVVGQAILVLQNNCSQANLGFIDWVHDAEVAKLLGSITSNDAKDWGAKQIKTPVDLNFFLRYRIRCPGGKRPVYGEPVYPDYYHKMFAEAGFVEAGRWNTFETKVWDTIKDFSNKRKSLLPNLKVKANIRCVRPSKWDEELAIIHKLFVSAYKNMPEYQSVSFPQFKLLYDDFRYLINPWLSFIAEVDGQPVGFSINFVDPLPLLQKIKGKNLNSVQKLWLLIRLRLNLGTLLIAHVGITPAPDGREIKGMQIQVAKRLSIPALMMTRVLSTFQNVNSPAVRSWNQEVIIPYAQYVIYGKEL